MKNGSSLQSSKEQSARPSQSKRSGLFIHDLALTMGAEAAAVLSNLVVASILSRSGGARALSEYLLLRRLLTWGVTGVLLGLANGLPRFVAHCVGERSNDGPVYFLVASSLMMVSASVASTALILGREWVAQWLFGTREESGLVISLALLILGFALHRAVHGHFRGLLDMRMANLLETLNAALIPLFIVVMLFRSESVAMIMGLTGCLTILLSAAFAIPLIKTFSFSKGIHLGIASRELLRYGIPRVPGEFGAAALMAAGPMIAVHFMGVADVSPLLLGLNVLMVVGYAAGPLGVVLLSKVSIMLGRNQLCIVQERLRLLLSAVMELSVFACVQIAIFADVMVRAWVGNAFTNEMAVVRITVLAIPPYLFFVTLRSTIDAMSTKALNASNVVVSLAIYLSLITGWVILFPVHLILTGIAGSLLGAQLILAFMTVRTFRKLYGFGIPWRESFPSLVAALTLGGIALIVRWFFGGSVSFPFALALEAALTCSYVTVLALRHSRWISYIWNVGVRQQNDWYPEAV